MKISSIERFALVSLVCVLASVQCRKTDAMAHTKGFCSVGSEVFNYPMDSWIDLYKERLGGVPPVHEGRGNGTAPGVLREGLCALAPMSRPMTDAEVHSLVEKYGSVPVAIPVAVDALAVAVPSKSPLAEATKEQVKRVFHELPESLADVFPGKFDAGVSAKTFGMNSASDRFRWFREAALQGKRFSDRTMETGGPLELVDLVGESVGGFGYARPAELTSRVRALSIRLADGELVPLTEETATSGEYPYARFLYVYLPPSETKPEGKALDFLRLILSPEGQARLRPLGLFPLAEGDREMSLQRLDAYR